VFAWQGFVSGGAIGVASVRSCKKLPPCLIKPVPAGSKMDLLLTKAKPVSDGCSASVITYLRSGEKMEVKKEDWDEVRETTLQTPRSVKKEGEEVLEMPEHLPLQLMMKTMVRLAVPLQPMEVHGGADIHL